MFDCPIVLSLMVSNTFACCTITKLLNSSTLRVVAVRAATALELERGTKPAARNSVGKRKLRMSPSTRMSATSAKPTLNILESSAHACSGEVEPVKFCSMMACGATRATATAEPVPALEDLDMRFLRRANSGPHSYYAEAWQRREQVTEVLQPGAVSVTCLRHGKVLLAPAAHSAIHGNHIGVAHFLQVVGCHCGAESSSAIQNHWSVKVGNAAFDVALDDSFTQVNCAGQMVFGEFALFSNVNE